MSTVLTILIVCATFLLAAYSAMTLVVGVANARRDRSRLTKALWFSMIFDALFLVAVVVWLPFGRYAIVPALCGALAGYAAYRTSELVKERDRLAVIAPAFPPATVKRREVHKYATVTALACCLSLLGAVVMSVQPMFTIAHQL